MSFINITNVCRIIVVLTEEYPSNAIVDNNGSTIYVRDAFLLRILLEKLFANCQLIAINNQGRYTNGTKADVGGMFLRSEVDILMTQSTITEISTKYYSYSYPTHIVPISFLTDKPEQIFKKSAILDPFSFFLWIFLITFLFLVSFLYYILTGKQVTFRKIMFNVFGNVVQQQPLQFALKKNSVRWLLFTWLLGIMVIGNSYKAALLSFLLAPTEFVIRDIPQLAEEANKHSVTCMTADFNYKNYVNTFRESNIESWKAVVECLERHKNSTSGKVFFNLPPKKAYVSDMLYKESLESYFFFPDDHFYIDMYGYQFSRSFSLTDRLNEILLRVQAAGLYEKYYRDEAFFLKLKRSGIPPLTKSNQISLNDVSGAFILLMFGWGLALITFFSEIVYYKLKLRV